MNQVLRYQGKKRDVTSTIYTAAAVDTDAAAAVNQAMSLAAQAAEQAHPQGFTITAVSHDTQLLTHTRTVEPNFYSAAVGASGTTVHDQQLLVTAAIVVQPLTETATPTLPTA